VEAAAEIHHVEAEIHHVKAEIHHVEAEIHHVEAEIHHVEAEAKAKAEVEAQQMEAMGKRPDPHSVLSRRR
jgi:peptidoglycan hydrolase CwlO-like protein